MAKTTIDKEKVDAVIRKNRARTIPRVAIQRLFKNKILNKNIRINNNAIDDLTRLFEILANNIAEESGRIAVKTGAKTITVEEIEPACIKYLGISLKSTVTNQKKEFEYYTDPKRGNRQNAQEDT